MDFRTAEMLATERQRQMIGETTHRRLVALATCCRVVGVARVVARVRDAWAALVSGRGVPCCTPA